MGVIAFTEDGPGWFAARWAFKRVLADASALASGDPDVEFILQQAAALDGFFLHLKVPDVGARAIDCIRRAARAAVEGSTLEGVLKWSQEITPFNHPAYQEAMSDLLRFLDQEQSRLKGN